VIESLFQEARPTEGTFDNSPRGLTLAEAGDIGFLDNTLVGVPYAVFHFGRFHLDIQESLAVFYFFFSYFQISSKPATLRPAV
jgi:hypothetical protein